MMHYSYEVTFNKKTDYKNPQKLRLTYCVYLKTEKHKADSKFYEMYCDKQTHIRFINKPFTEIKQYKTQ
jgi:hypothetical protein